MRAVFAVVLLLAGEPVRFDANMHPQFSKTQITNSAASTRDGLTRWSATEEGRAVLEEFDDDCTINVIEDAMEDGLGRAPQPGIATLIAASNHAAAKSYDVVFNPLFFRVPDGMTPLPHQPASPADMMAAAWAGEMLHVLYYARGISLPHHQREDFQRDWRRVAGELGMPMLTHGDEDERRQSRARVIVLRNARRR